MLLGHWIEMKSVTGASKELQLLVKLIPSDAHMVMPGMVQDVKTDTLRVNDVILIKPGEKVAADGLILGGESYLNESMVTGESKPIKKMTGDKDLPIIIFVASLMAIRLPPGDHAAHRGAAGPRPLESRCTSRAPRRCRRWATSSWG